jgi:DNA-binding PadR family transcriptional regulator
MDLSATATVILGFLSRGEMSGYDIKSEVDTSTRFFWAASYGQIYPELKRLKTAGLIEEVDGPQGDRRRTACRITDAGRMALQDWLSDGSWTPELRHEGLLKVFFSDATSKDRRRSLMEDIARHHRGQLAELRELAETEGAVETGSSPELILRFGLDFQEWIVEWWEDEIARTDDGGSNDGQPHV